MGQARSQLFQALIKALGREEGPRAQQLSATALGLTSYLMVPWTSRPRGLGWALCVPCVCIGGQDLCPFQPTVLEVEFKHGQSPCMGPVVAA